MLQAQAISVEVGGKLLVDRASFTVMARDKVGIVGRNGAGKTSLFKVLGGENEPAGGNVLRKGGFGYLPQDPKIDTALDGRTCVTHILSGKGIDDEMMRMEKLRIAMEENPDERNVSRYLKAEEMFRTTGGYSAESEARAMAVGLGLPHDRLDLPLSVLSGGERRRVELSRILFAGTDVLCLDEPTNHLDADAKTWLLQYMRQYKGAMLVISHDLDLLDEAITRVIHLDRADENAVGEIFEYKGTYSQYKRSRAEDEARLTKKAAQQTKEIARMQGVVDRFGAKATKATMAHSMEKKIARLETTRVNAPKNQKTFNVRFPPPPPCGETVITGTSLCKGYNGVPVFEDIDFDLGRGERLLVLGLNGAGKTSLLRILAGETDADLGNFEFGYQVQSGYYAQEHDNLRVHENLLTNIRDSVPRGVEMDDSHLRGLLGMFGLSGDKVFQDSGTLSGGEKTKLALAMLMTGKNNMLLLDEPTNNLDPPSREAITNALIDWPGAIIFVSHDTDFVKELAPTKVLLMPDGDLDYFSEEWLELVELA